MKCLTTIKTWIFLGRLNEENFKLIYYDFFQKTQVVKRPMKTSSLIWTSDANGSTPCRLSNTGNAVDLGPNCCPLTFTSVFA